MGQGGTPAQVVPGDLVPASAAERVRSLSRKEQIWIFVEDNTIVNSIILLVIVFSTICFVLETEFKDDDLKLMWFGYVCLYARHAAVTATEGGLGKKGGCFRAGFTAALQSSQILAAQQPPSGRRGSPRLGCRRWC